jgi:hypothetical protein
MAITKNFSMKSFLNQIVPISRFNRGEANKIFEELKKTGVKAVFKNNVRVGVLVEPGQYDEMVELLEDFALSHEAERREKNARVTGYLSEAQVLTQHRIAEAELDEAEEPGIE